MAPGAHFFSHSPQPLRMITKRFEPAAGGVSLAVVLSLTVLLDDRLGCQRDDFLNSGELISNK